MREVLELLGLIAPPPGRREPVALPAWSRRLLPLVAVGLVVATALVAVAIGHLLG